MKAALFDMDGVICNTQTLHNLCYKEIAMEKYGKVLTDETCKKFEGLIRREVATLFLHEMGLTPTKTLIEQTGEEKNARYLALIKEKGASLLFPGIVPLLKRLQDNNIPTAVASASANAALIIEKTGLSPYFQYIVDASKVKKGKPNPEIFLSAAAALSQKPKDCVVYEDAKQGVQAARDGGMFAVGIGQNGERSLKSLEDPRCYLGLYDQIKEDAHNAELFIIEINGREESQEQLLLSPISDRTSSQAQQREIHEDYRSYQAPLLDGTISIQQYCKHREALSQKPIDLDRVLASFSPLFPLPIIQMVHTLKAHKKRVVLALNTFSPFEKIYQEQEEYALFDHVYMSCHLGLHLPQASFFHAILAHEKVTAEKTFYVGNSKESRITAGNMNIESLLYSGADTQKALSSLF